MSQECGTLEEFEKLCVIGLAKKYAEALAEQANFTTDQWMELYQTCLEHIPIEWIYGGPVLKRAKRCHNMQIIALKKAVAIATTREDWENIHRHARSGKQRTLARDKLLELIRTK